MCVTRRLAAPPTVHMQGRGAWAEPREQRPLCTAREGTALGPWNKWRKKVPKKQKLSMVVDTTTDVPHGSTERASPARVCDIRLAKLRVY